MPLVAADWNVGSTGNIRYIGSDHGIGSTSGGWTAQIAGTTLTISGSGTGTFGVGSRISGGTISDGTKITALGTGTGGAGTYTVNNSQTVTAGTAIAGNVSSYATVIEFHRWLGQLMDDAAASGDDILDITDATASERSTDNIITLINGFNIDQTAAEHLFDGSIIQAGGADIWDGILVFATPGMHLEIQQNATMVANDFWNTIPSGSALKGLNSDAANGISHRFLLKVRTSGTDIDLRKIVGQTRETGFTYSEFKINGTSRGNNVMALTYAADLNNTTPEGTIATWTGITNTFQGYNAIDIDNNAVNEFYYSKWDRNIYTINQFYERMKYITRRGTTDTLYGLNGEVFRGITHEVQLTTPRSGTFNAFEAVSWPGGTGQMLAIDSTTAGTKMWIQLLTGVAPSGSNTITGTTSSAVATNTGTPIERTLSFPFVGVSTGSALIGSYGLALEATDLAASDKVFDLTNTQRVPPNYVQFTVSGLVASEDRVLVGPATGGLLADGQFLLNAGITAGATSIVVKVGTETPGTGTLSATDTPATGTIRIRDNNGVYFRVTYTGYTVAASTMTFTGCTGAPTAAINNPVFISYIDVLASSTSAFYTCVYGGSTRNLFVRVRDGAASPIKTFETPATLGSSGGSASAIRTSDA